MYLGMAMMLAGLGGLLGTLTPFAVVPAFVCIISARFIPPEERAMEETFGQAYRQYRNRVRRWI